MTSAKATLTAVALALAATLAVYLYASGVNRRQSAMAAGGDTTVVVAQRDIPVGSQLDDLISSGALTTVQVARAEVVSGAATKMAQLEGHKTRAAILAGEQIPMARIDGSNELPGGVLGIPHGYQAVSFDLEPQRIVGGTVKAGDYVAVYATFQDVRVTGGGHVPRGLSGTADDSFSATSLIASDVRVLKVDGGASGSIGVSTTSSTQSGSGIEVILAVTPTAAEKMVFSQDLGKMYLSLLPPQQDGKIVPPISFWQVLR